MEPAAAPAARSQLPVPGHGTEQLHAASVHPSHVLSTERLRFSIAQHPSIQQDQMPGILWSLGNLLSKENFLKPFIMNN